MIEFNILENSQEQQIPFHYFTDGGTEVERGSRDTALESHVD